MGTDDEMRMMFAVFDENRSWYIDQNIREYSSDPSKVDPSDPDFYSSNIIYSKSTAPGPLNTLNVISHFVAVGFILFSITIIVSFTHIYI